MARPDGPGAGRAPAATVLVVDDDVLIAMSTAMMLEDLGHRVIEVQLGAAALEILKTTPAVDMLLTDHAMPEMTGRGTCPPGPRASPRPADPACDRLRRSA